MKILLLLSAASLALAPNAHAQDTIPLWPGIAPGSPAVARPERSDPQPLDTLRGPVTLVGNIDRPTITFYPADRAKRTGAALLVFPGGGYNILAIDLEGTDICRWAASNGIACGVVKYRVPQPRSSGPLLPLQDAQRAVRLLRSRAGQLGIDSARIGVLGFSAGAHVLARLSNHYSENTYQPSDAVDRQSGRPNFVLLIYPAYLVADQPPRTLAADVQPTRQTPPTFLVQTDDDPVGIANSVEYAKALSAVGVPVEFHEFPKGGHGYGMRPRANAMASVWPGLALKWISAQASAP